MVCSTFGVRQLAVCHVVRPLLGAAGATYNGACPRGVCQLTPEEPSLTCSWLSRTLSSSATAAHCCPTTTSFSSSGDNFCFAFASCREIRSEDWRFLMSDATEPDVITSAVAPCTDLYSSRDSEMTFEPKSISCTTLQARLKAATASIRDEFVGREHWCPTVSLPHFQHRRTKAPLRVLGKSHS